jgi:hypothetical protein
MNRISDDPLIVALGVQRDRIYAARAAHGSGLFDQVAELHAYRDMLTRCDMPQHRLVQAKEELNDRLADGWGKIAGNPKHERHWLELLVRYEAVCDALDVPAARARLSAAEAVVILTDAQVISV